VRGDDAGDERYARARDALSTDVWFLKFFEIFQTRRLTEANLNRARSDESRAERCEGDGGDE